MIKTYVGDGETLVKKFKKNTIGCNEFTIVEKNTTNAPKGYKYGFKQ